MHTHQDDNLLVYIQGIQDMLIYIGPKNKTKSSFMSYS